MRNWGRWVREEFWEWAGFKGQGSWAPRSGPETLTTVNRWGIPPFWAYTELCHMLLMVPGAEASMRAITLDGAPCSWSPNLLQPLMASEKCKSCSRSSSRKVPCYPRFLSTQNKRTPSWVTGYITRPRGNLDSTWCQRGVLVTQESGKETGTAELKEPKAMVHTNVADQSCIVFCNCTFKT